MCHFLSDHKTMIGPYLDASTGGAPSVASLERMTAEVRASRERAIRRYLQRYERAHSPGRSRPLLRGLARPRERARRPEHPRRSHRAAPGHKQPGQLQPAGFTV